MHVTVSPLFASLDEDGNSHFNMRFLGSVEVSGHKGDDVLCQAINKVRPTSGVSRDHVFYVIALIIYVVLQWLLNGKYVGTPTGGSLPPVSQNNPTPTHRVSGDQPIRNTYAR